MDIVIRNDSVVIDGYVNATNRLSKPIYSRSGKFVEKILTGAFSKALERNSDVKCLLNHDWNRVLGSTLENVELKEDNIGLKIRAEITDNEIIKKAKNNEFSGFSFGFRYRETENSFDNDSKLPMVNVRDLDLYEVSLLDLRKSPAYEGCLVEVRDNEEEPINLFEENSEEINIIDETTEQEQTPVEDAEKPLDAPVEDVEEITQEDVESTTDETTDENTIPSEDYFTEYKELISKLKEIVKEFE